MNDDWEFQILEMLDEYASQYLFPMPDNIYFYYGKMRLTVFRSPEDWLFVFEELRYLSEPPSFEVTPYVYGNRVDTPGMQAPIYQIEEAPGQPIRVYKKGFALDQFDFQLRINGEVRSFTPSREDYARAGVDVDSDIPHACQVVRYLAVALADEMFATDEQLISALGGPNSKLNRFMQLDDWYHPNLADDELPGETETFQMLAAAVTRNDPTLYQPAETPNTHWSNWPIYDR